jgi:hypothetical protein
MTGSERDWHVAERAHRILNDDDAVAAYAAFVDGQLRHRRLRRLLAGLRALARILVVVAGAAAPRNQEACPQWED